MKRAFIPTIILSACSALASTGLDWLPTGLPPAPAEGPALCTASYLTPAQGQSVLAATLARFPDQTSWQAYAEHLRTRIQEGAGLSPWPRRTALNPIIHSRRTYDGYSVESVAFESVPGYFVTGNLYRPLHASGRCPAILSTHGHTNKIEKPEDYDKHGRFAEQMQTRCGALARMGAVVLSIDMFGCGDSIQLVGPNAHRTPFALTLQLWNATRAIDFLLTLDDVDPKRIAVSGESGGGTQAFVLTALDPRISLSVPVVMVSSYFFGGCPCESGLPIHRSADHFASNAMIAALAAPRPMLVVSDGGDWTLNVPQVEYPFLQHIYGYYSATDNVANVHLPLEGHNYGPSKRAALYRFVAARFGLNLAAVQNAKGEIDESRVTLEPHGRMHVFDQDFPVPAKALRDTAAIEASLRALQETKTAAAQ